MVYRYNAIFTFTSESEAYSLGLLFSSGALTLLVGRQEMHPVCKKLGFGLLVGDDLTGALHVYIAPVVTTTSIILSSNKIQNRDILVPDCRLFWKMAVKGVSSSSSEAYAIKLGQSQVLDILRHSGSGSDLHANFATDRRY